MKNSLFSGLYFYKQSSLALVHAVGVAAVGEAKSTHNTSVWYFSARAHGN